MRSSGRLSLQRRMNRGGEVWEWCAGNGWRLSTRTVSSLLIVLVLLGRNASHCQRQQAAPVTAAQALPATDRSLVLHLVVQVLPLVLHPLGRNASLS